MTAESPKILVTLMGSLGDVARGLAVVPAIKSHWPKAHITWLVEPKCAGLVALAAGIDQMLVFPRGQGILAYRRALRELRARRYDVALDMQRHAKSGLLSFLSRAPRRIGFARSNAKEGNWLLSTESIPPYAEQATNKFEAYQRFLDVLGVPRLVPPAQAGLNGQRLRPELESLLGGFSRLVGVVLGSSWSSKDWFRSGYQQVAERLLTNPRVGLVLLGDKSHAVLADALVNQLPKDRVCNLAGKSSLQDLLAVLERVAVAFGPDSGPGHLAAALGRPYVALFGPTSAVRTAPWGSEELALSAELGCSPCYRRRCPGLGKICMQMIGPDEVALRLERFL